MKPEFLGIDPVSGLAVFRAADGSVHHVDAQSSVYARGMMPGAAPPPPPGLRDARMMPRTPNAPSAPIAETFPNFLVERDASSGTSGRNLDAMRAQPAALPPNATIDPTTDPAMPADLAMQERLRVARTRPNR